MFIFQKSITLPLNMDQANIKQKLLHNSFFDAKEDNATLILSRHRHIPRIPFINKFIRLLVARVTAHISIENRGLKCRFSINREAVFGFIIILSGVIAQFTGNLVEEDIPPAFVYVLAAIYAFFLIHELYKNYSLIKKIATS